MDPNETLEIIEGEIGLLLYSEREALREACYDLREWLDMGGFEPNWSKYPIASNYFNGLDRAYFEGMT